MKRFFVLAALCAGLAVASITSASATNEGVCVDNGTKVDVVGSHESITVTAPAGYLISGYCVKAGSVRQGLGPEYYTVDPPAVSVTIEHSSGKDISHYTITLVEIETPPTTTVPPVTTLPPTTTVPPVTTVAPTTTINVPTTTITEAPAVETFSAPAPLDPMPTTLAYTGSQTPLLMALGFIVLALGFALKGIARRL